jgi:hypothetical protein
MSVLRVFPRKTKATPDDDMVRIGIGDVPDNTSRIEISCLFTWDRAEAERLYNHYRQYGLPVAIGGVALNSPAHAFIPGKYIKHGYVITSRGCPNHCWFCDVHDREGGIRELPITDGSNLLDSNLLACSDEHIRKVLDMLGRHKNPQISGGLEAKRLKLWQAQQMKRIKMKQLFFAYDCESQTKLDELREAARLCFEAGFTPASKALRCFVLIGFPGDTLHKAEGRLRDVARMGYTPMAMLYRSREHVDWAGFQRMYTRPAIMASLLKDYIKTN